MDKENLTYLENVSMLKSADDNESLRLIRDLNALENCVKTLSSINTDGVEPLYNNAHKYTPILRDDIKPIEHIVNKGKYYSVV